MIYQFEGEVFAEYPKEGQRPSMRQTFMLIGIAVTWETAPTTVEDIELLLVVDDKVQDTPLVHKIDPSVRSATDWVHTVADGPVALPNGLTSRVTYPNTDATIVKVMFLGYWR